MTGNNNQEGKSFTPPTHLFNDLIALCGFLTENYPEETAMVSVTAPPQSKGKISSWVMGLCFDLGNCF